ncbi:glycosyltransferase family 2 protein [Gelidibacter mesophilus]|uniref:glycosyltransferase family 2 protein n=1 Tax=Gelidibacter mesophilus TaxID=169050 RepID=UPI0003FF756F|nr:glycosyltransferase family 2 protein [Gelidibacter mesophilus]
MNFSLIICTYMRPDALLNLLDSVKVQSLYPNEILIIDGSPTTETEQRLKLNSFKNLSYYKVEAQHLGLTKQRNYGISKVDQQSEVICFLDDDTILEVDYFEQMVNTYDCYPNALGVGGYITNEVEWQKTEGNNTSKRFYYDGWMRSEPLRFRVRHWFGLHPDTPPCYLPTFSHGRSVSFLPPSGKIYPAELFMGGVSSYKRSVFDSLSFSTYFEGYGLYEDADFCLRLAKKGALYVNTAARLEHHHDQLGRPNKYHYGKMVIRNGWYIWRVKYSDPSWKALLKWHLTAILLLKLTFLGVLTQKDKMGAFNEGLGRCVGWWSLFFNKQKLTL